MKILGKFLGIFSYDIAIDLGTANTLLFIKDKGLMIREPSVVARHKKTKKVLAIGAEAKKMIGKTPISIDVIRPLRHGVISDFDATEAMLKYFIGKVHKAPGAMLPRVPRPKVVVGIPSGVTEVERRAVAEAIISSGAREVFLVEEPMAAAIGSDLAISEPNGVMIVDIGGGTTEIAVISLGGIVVNRSIRVAGDEMEIDIINYLRVRYGLLIGEKTAEEIKLSVGNVYSGMVKREIVVRGRSLETGLPKSVKLTADDAREAITPTIKQIIQSILDTIEDTPPELVADITESGITLAGGGALIPGIAKLLSEETKMPVFLADDPLTAVVRGCSALLTNQELLNKVKISGKI